jgi:YHS domain-containing protein
MKKENTKCSCCDVETQGETCQLAAYKTTVDGKTYTFCCQPCAPKNKEVTKK